MKALQNYSNRIHKEYKNGVPDKHNANIVQRHPLLTKKNERRAHGLDN
jgi:hypothetical protein